MAFLIEHQWNIFIILEVSSLLFLLLFILIRYAFSNLQLSRLFMILFFVALISEAILAYIIYKGTGEVTTFQIVIAVFIIYAATFGINDFKRLDRYIKEKVGKWRGVDLLTDKEKEIIEHLKDPKVIARRARYWFYAHSFVIIVGLSILWYLYGNKDYSPAYFLTHFTWYNDDSVIPQPFINEYVLAAAKLWLLIYVIDSIVNWYPSFFPEKRK